ncbi:MAG: hypothetical protein Athens071426_499 [Parcubacteria group bacterium Athens0714_26]|nr:MAG: hypothetical protein Athens101426_489 [Parcubacteria group bacterium Athens1014_26]TSD02415.1 MAG: hypothetical protein Athens071426_499 [Parcubacteria group bacterium Athens0714_26]
MFFNKIITTIIVLLVLTLVLEYKFNTTQEIVNDLSKKRVELGIVTYKIHLDSRRQFVKIRPEENFIKIQTSIGNVTWNDKNLFNNLNVGDKIPIEIIPQYIVTKDKKTGAILSKFFSRYEINFVAE